MEARVGSRIESVVQLVKCLNSVMHEDDAMKTKYDKHSLF